VGKDSGMQTSDIIISIKPEHVQNIMAGHKTIELRRRFPDGLADGRIMLIYSSSPERALVGAVRIEQVRRMATAALWQAYRKQACVARDVFDDYFAGATEGFGVLLGTAIRFDVPIPVSELRDRFRFSPPQSFRYLRGSLIDLLNDERIQIPDRHEHRNRPRGQSARRCRSD
jgi:predicted transcriptional regulator